MQPPFLFDYRNAPPPYHEKEENGRVDRLRVSEDTTAAEGLVSEQVQR